MDGVDTFKCDVCGGTFPKGWSDDEALAELEKAFPGTSPEGCGRVCEDCHDVVMFVEKRFRQ